MGEVGEGVCVCVCVSVGGGGSGVWEGLGLLKLCVILICSDRVSHG